MNLKSADVGDGLVRSEYDCLMLSLSHYVMQLYELESHFCYIIDFSVVVMYILLSFFFLYLKRYQNPYFFRLWTPPVVTE